MHLVPSSPPATTRFATAEEVADLELAGAWVVDVRRQPRPERTGWLVDWEDDIVFLADSPDLPAEAASEQLWPLDAA